MLLFLINVILCAVVEIDYTQYSSSSALGRGQGTSTNPNNENYGAILVFHKKVKHYTSSLCGDSELVTFKEVSRTLNKGCNDFQTVAGAPGCVLDPPLSATFQSGNSLDSTWGFIMNAGVPFTMSFEDYMNWLYIKGTGGIGKNMIDIAQKFVDINTETYLNSLKIFPALGGPRQMSGLFPFDMKEGLRKLCTSGLRLRLLSPYQNVLTNACQFLIDKGKINIINMSFFPAVGGVPLLAFIQNVTLNPSINNDYSPVTGFEFASALDNYNALTGGFFPNIKSNSSLASPTCNGKDAVSFPLCLQNPGHKGLIYLHYLNWHQPQLIAWMMINSTIFSKLSNCQQKALQKAGKDSAFESFEKSTSVDCKITNKILQFNNGQFQLNSDGTPKDCSSYPGLQKCSADIKLGTWLKCDLKQLQNQTILFLRSLSNLSSQTKFIIDSLYNYEKSINFKWKNVGYEEFCEKDYTLLL